MPNMDGTGPEGKGPRTGRQQGKCADAQPPGRRPCGREMRRGWGRCRRSQTADQ
ncbi:MAG: DUF5320 domain-containing protein [Nanoarchaeota archaeon]